MDGMGGELLAMRRIRGDAYVREPRDACWSNASHLLMLTLSCRILYHACATRSKERKEKKRRREEEKKKKRRGEEEKKREEEKRREQREPEHNGMDGSRMHRTGVKNIGHCARF